MEFFPDKNQNTGAGANGKDAFDEAFWAAQFEEYGVGMDCMPDSIEASSDIQGEPAKCKTEQAGFTETKAVRIDSLLTIENPDDVDDLGHKLFCMLDRFNSALNQFGQEYNALCQERAYKIEKAEDDANRKKMRFLQENNDAIAEVQQEKDRTIQGLKAQLEEGIENRRLKLQRDTDTLGQYTSSSKEKLKVLRVSNESSRNAVKERILDNIAQYYEAVHSIVNRTIASEMDAFQRSCLQAGVSDNQMEFYLSEKHLGYVKTLYEAIYQECQKIFCRKLRDLCKKISEAYGMSQRAFQILQNKHKAEEDAMTNERSAEISKRKKGIEQLEALNLAEDKRQRLDTEDQITQIEQGANVCIERITRNYEIKKTDIEEKHKADVDKLNTKWYEILAYSKTGFYQYMEAAFPSACMKKLFMKLQGIRDYVNIASIQKSEQKRNIAIGIAKVCCMDQAIRGSEAYRIILPLLKEKYDFMFFDSYACKAISVPYIVSVDNGIAMLLKYNNRFESMVQEQINGIGIRMLWAIPASLQEFCLLDSISIGSFAALQSMDPAKNPDAASELVRSILVGDQVFSKKADIAKQIDRMRERFDNRKGLMKEWKVLREFNASHFMSREAYQMAIIQHFPMNMEENDIMTISTMIRDCRQEGFSALLTMPDTCESYIKDQEKLRVRELESYVRVLQLQDNGSYVIASACKTEAEKSAEISIFTAPDDARLTEMRSDFYSAVLEARKVTVDFNVVVPAERDRYSYSSSQGLIIPLGLNQGGSKFELRMNDVHIHTVISGVTGSGKTNLLHALLMNLMLRYSPDEAEIYLVDYKHGVDFSIYSNYNLPNFRIISISAEAEHPLEMLLDIEREFDERSKDLEDYGGISPYNKRHPDCRMKRIVLVLDELYNLMEESGKSDNQHITAEIMRIIVKVAHQARAVGIHMVICGQDMAKIDGIQNVISQCANRIEMYNNDDDVGALLGSGNAFALVNEIKPSSQGTCVVSSDYAKTAHLTYIAKVELDDQRGLLKEIDAHYTSLGREANVRILLSEPSKSKRHPFCRFVNEGILPAHNCLQIGDSLSLLQEFNYYPKRNLWIIGGDSIIAEMAGYGVMFSCMLSLLFAKMNASARGEEFEILCSDGSDDGTGITNRNNRFWQFCNALRDREDLIDYASGVDLSKHIDKLRKVICERNGSENKGHPIWLLISRVEECFELSDQEKMALRRILDEGPKNKVYTIVWTKVAEFARDFHLSDAPCDKLVLEVDDPGAYGLKIKNTVASEYKALLIEAKGCMRLRLYNLPSRSWIEDIKKRLDMLK